MKLQIRKGATVEVIAGTDKGKRGSVLEVNKTKLAVRVQGVRIQTHYDRKEGLLKKEGYIHYSNLKLIEAVKAEAKKTRAPRAKAK